MDDITASLNTATYITRDSYITNIATDAWISDTMRCATMNDLDNLAKRLYKIITEHTKIDISEEEFISLLRE